MTASAAAVRMTGISKAFGGVRALDDVSFEVLPGEVHALLGGNGAGKSTILKVLNGVHRPDQGAIEVGGVPLTVHTPEASRAAGIAMNYQEMSLVPTLTVAQNIFLTRECRDGMGLIDDREAERRAADIFALLEVFVDPKAVVADLGPARSSSPRSPRRSRRMPGFWFWTSHPRRSRFPMSSGSSSSCAS